MSFLSVFKKIGGILLTADQIAAPIVGAVNPVVGHLMADLPGLLQSTVVSAEATVQGAKQGNVKADTAANLFNGGLALTQSIFADQGKQLTYDAGLWKTANDAWVAAYNATAALKGSFKIDDLPKQA